MGVVPSVRDDENGVPFVSVSYLRVCHFCPGGGRGQPSERIVVNFSERRDGCGGKLRWHRTGGVVVDRLALGSIAVLSLH